MWLILINLFSILNIAIICIYLLSRKNNILPNYILALAFFIPGLYFIDNILILNNQLTDFPYAFFLVQTVAILFPPSVYYYVHLLLSQKRKIHPLLALGSALLLFFILIITFDFSQLSSIEKNQFISNLGSENNYPDAVLLYTVVFYLWQLVYLGKLFYDVEQYYKLAQDSFSNLERIKIEYLRKFMLLLGVLSLGLVIAYASLPLPVVDYGILPSYVSIINVFIIYFAVKHKAIFNKNSYLKLVIENQSMLPNSIEEIQPVNQQKLTELGVQLAQLIVSKKLYQNPDFSLAHLAMAVSEPNYLVSQALNKHFGKPFFDIVNELRIEDALKLLASETAKKYTIEAICFEVGFNSRAAFYRAFKKQTGRTPSDFIN